MVDILSRGATRGTGRRHSTAKATRIDSQPSTTNQELNTKKRNPGGSNIRKGHLPVRGHTACTKSTMPQQKMRATINNVQMMV